MGTDGLAFFLSPLSLKASSSRSYRVTRKVDKQRETKYKVADVDEENLHVSIVTTSEVSWFSFLWTRC